MLDTHGSIVESLREREGVTNMRARTLPLRIGVMVKDSLKIGEELVVNG
jgi:hypothetical protein